MFLTVCGGFIPRVAAINMFRSVVQCMRNDYCYRVGFLSIQVGKTPDGFTFDEVTENHSARMLAPFADFMSKVYIKITG